MRGQRPRKYWFTRDSGERRSKHRSVKKVMENFFKTARISVFLYLFREDKMMNLSYSHSQILMPGRETLPVQ